MPFANFARWSGIAAILGGVLWSASIFVSDLNSTIADILFFLIPLLFLVGLAGLYTHCRGRLGVWEALSRMGFLTGVVGLVVASIGTLGTGVQGGGFLWVAELSWWAFAFGYFVLSLGLLLLGYFILQTGPLTRLRGLPLGIGILGLLVILIPPWAFPGAGVVWGLYGLGWAVLGYGLLSGVIGSDPRSARVR